MRKGFLTATTIVLVCAASAWSQESQSSTSVVSQGSAEVPSSYPQADPELVPKNEAAPWTGGTPSYFGNGNQYWGSAQILPWWIKQQHVPVLATSGTLASGGALGPGTTTLLGGALDHNLRLGGRFTLGGWLDPGRTKGIEGSYFFLNGPSGNGNVNSSDLPSSMVLARPFVNAITGLQDSQLVSFPGFASGNVQVSSGSQLQGAQLNMLCNACCCCNNCCDPCQTGCCVNSGYRLDWVTGFAYLGFRENLTITENIAILPSAPFAPGETIMVTDSFQTRNNFYGAQIGARAEWWRGGWFANVLGQVALGDTHQQVRINGTTVFTDPGFAPVTQQGGLLALPTNIGTYNRDRFTAVPQISFNVGRQVTGQLRLYVGYTLLYWSNVARPGDQIDTTVNPTQLPTSTGPGMLVGPARPAFVFHDTAFWAQGINFGFAFTR